MSILRSFPDGNYPTTIVTSVEFDTYWINATRQSAKQSLLPGTCVNAIHTESDGESLAVPLFKQDCFASCPSCYTINVRTDTHRESSDWLGLLKQTLLSAACVCKTGCERVSLYVHVCVHVCVCLCVCVCVCVCVCEWVWSVFIFKSESKL